VKNSKNILIKRLLKATSHYKALKSYKKLIMNLQSQKNIYDLWNFNTLKVEERAYLDAYLKRFASLQDFLGAKVFPLLLDVAGIKSDKMSEVLYYIEREEIIDNFEQWIDLREARNELEHDYPEELKEALSDLKFCIDGFELLETIYFNSIEFAKRYIDADFE
jgi:predicted ABC-class ATPase